MECNSLTTFGKRLGIIGQYVPWDSNRFKLKRHASVSGKLSDAELIRYGRASAGMCSLEANFGEPPRQVFVEQLREARAEWRRCHPPSATPEGSFTP
jgi:hypothetical protein